MVCVILDSTGVLQIKTGGKNSKEMLKHKMLILQEWKSAIEIRGICWYVNGETSKDYTVKLGVNHCCSRQKPPAKVFCSPGDV